MNQLFKIKNIVITNRTSALSFSMITHLKEENIINISSMTAIQTITRVVGDSALKLLSIISPNEWILKHL